MLVDSPDVVNICFHGIGAPNRALEAGEDRYWINQDSFERILDAVAGDGRVHISFDDGNASDVEIGLPALLERGMRGTFYVLAGRLDSPGSLSREDLRHLASAGMTVGSHGMDHRPWRGMTAAEEQRELVAARAAIEAAAGTPIDRAALPLGRYDRRTLSRLRHHGYASVATSDRQWARSAAWLQPRFSVRAGDTVETMRAEVLEPASLAARARLAAVGLLKRLR